MSILPKCSQKKKQLRRKKKIEWERHQITEGEERKIEIESGGWKAEQQFREHGEELHVERSMSLTRGKGQKAQACFMRR